MHTLEEHHEHLLSASFEQSFYANDPGGDISSSQAGPVFENFFAFSDGLEVGEGIGDELARELGWGSPVKTPRVNKEQFVILSHLAIYGIEQVSQGPT